MQNGRFGNMLELYQHKKVFITGHTGFKGSWLSLWLQELGADVKGYALAPDTTPNHFTQLHLDMDSELNDIRDLETLKKSIHAFQPEIIFHLAAQPLVITSYHDPLLTFSSNIMGTANLLEAARNCDSLKAIVVITTDKVYENINTDAGYSESDPLGGYDPYSASKAAAEIVTQSYIRSFYSPEKLNLTHHTLVASARAGNVIGGGDWAPYRLVPDIIRSIANQKELTIRYPKSTRPWQHVLDCLQGYLLLGSKLLMGEKTFSGAWNFGPSQPSVFTVEEVVNIATTYFNRLQVTLEKSDWHEASKLQLNVTKSLEKLGMQAMYTDHDLFTETFDWYNRYLEQGEVISKQVLKNYMERLPKN
jgi:CDP-glucose 4,6-dehydratase